MIHHSYNRYYSRKRYSNGERYDLLTIQLRNIQASSEDICAYSDLGLSHLTQADFWHGLSKKNSSTPVASVTIVLS